MKSNPVYHLCVVFVGLLGVTTAAGQEPITFRKAVELALAQSSEMALSHADEERAYQIYLEARDTYIPKVAIGSDIGYSHGFPLSLEGSAPTLFNVQTQSSVWNPAQREFIRAAKADWSASKSQGSNQRAQVILLSLRCFQNCRMVLIYGYDTTFSWLLLMSEFRPSRWVRWKGR